MRGLGWLFLLQAALWAGDGAPLVPQGMRTGRVTLLGRSKHGNYEKATFSFEHGLRDDPRRIVRNDWDLQFGNGGDRVFSVRMVTDDRSTIHDLGAHTFDKLPAPKVPAAVAGGANTTALAVEGHMYLVHTKDGGSDHFSLFRVVKLVPGDSVTIDWMIWDPRGGSQPFGASLNPKRLGELAGMLQKARERIVAAQRQRVGIIKDPAGIVLQIRTAAQGGNESRIGLHSPKEGHRVRMSPRPLGFHEMPAAQRILGGYVHGGSIPADKALVIESVDVYATAAGDSNGHGELKLKIGGRTLLKLYDQKGPFLNWYSGAVVVRPGEEHTIELGAANSSSADVRIRGRLVPLNQAGAVQTRPLALGEPPQGVKRAGGGDPKARSHLLLQPNAVLQVRAGAGGGNPNRIDLSGKKSIYIRRISDEQLSFDKPVRMKERAVAFYDGGLIPKNKVFVVTQVTYAGTAAGDTNGPGEFLVSIGGTKIVHERNKRGPIRGQWQGRIEIAPGQENTVYLEVANSSTGNVKIHGRFADRK